jgi:Flp pilus assembly protein TadD
VTGGGDPAAEIRALVKQRNELIRDDADHYQILGVDRDASEAQLRSAYFALARRLHPDRLAALDIRDMDEQAQQVFARINAAFSILGATDRRAAYDAELGRGGARVAAAEQAEAEKLAARIFGAEEAYHQGEVALRRQNHAAAVEHFRRAAELNPQEGEYHALLAWAVWCHASDQAAVTAEVRRMMNKAIALAPNNATVYFYRGMLARQLGQEETAEQCFRKVLELRPDHPEAGLELRLLEARRKTADKQGGLFGRLTRR